jgi:hypothetical protein
MKKFKVRYYELGMNDQGEQFEEVREDEIQADSFFYSNGIIFVDSLNSNVAFYERVISVKEVK